MGARLQEQEKIMKCVICRDGKTRPGKATVMLERDGMTLVIKGVPAEICTNCGEEYVEEGTSTLLLKIGEEAAKSGVRVSVRDYIAA
jgi:YgiT-type zinc finger domain-containing protein